MHPTSHNTPFIVHRFGRNLGLRPIHLLIVLLGNLEYVNGNACA